MISWGPAWIHPPAIGGTAVCCHSGSRQLTMLVAIIFVIISLFFLAQAIGVSVSVSPPWPCFQGCKTSWIFLTHHRSLSTFLQDFYEEIDKDDKTKPMKWYVKHGLMTLSLTILLQPLQIIILHNDHDLALPLPSEFGPTCVNNSWDIPNLDKCR